MELERFPKKVYLRIDHHEQELSEQMDFFDEKKLIVVKHFVKNDDQENVHWC